MGFDVEISADFERLAVAAILPKLRRLRGDIENDMHENHRPHIDTGTLDRSIFCELDEVTGTIEGGATAPYADDIELGHDDHGTFVGPFPFVRPAFQKRRGEL